MIRQNNPELILVYSHLSKLKSISVTDSVSIFPVLAAFSFAVGLPGSKKIGTDEKGLLSVPWLKGHTP